MPCAPRGQWAAWAALALPLAGGVALSTAACLPALTPGLPVPFKPLTTNRKAQLSEAVRGAGLESDRPDSAPPPHYEPLDTGSPCLSFPYYTTESHPLAAPAQICPATSLSSHEPRFL